jgi:protein SCO1
MKSRVFIPILLVALSAGFLTYYYYAYKQHPRSLATLGQAGHVVGAFSFVNQDSVLITEKDVAGKIKVVEYFFTTCQGICPKMNENMSKVFQEFRSNDNVVILSHTVNPEIDTVAQMKRYAQKFEADGKRWHFLTGTKQALYDKAINDYLVTAADSGQGKVTPDFIHTERFVLVDDYNRIRGRFYDGTNPADVQQLITDIKEILKEMKKL